MGKKIAFYHDNNIDMLKLGFTQPKLGNICLYKSTDAKLYPFTEGDKDLVEKFREDVVGGPFNVFTRKTVDEETFIRKSTNICKSIVGIDASQLYPCFMCQPMPTGLYSRWDFDSEASRFTPRQNNPVALKIWSCLIFNEQDLIVKMRASTLQADRRKLIVSVLMGFVLIAILCLKPWIAFTTSVLLSRMIIPRNEWTCLLTLLWSLTIWKLLQRLSSFQPDETSSFKKTFSTMLQFVGLLLQ